MLGDHSIMDPPDPMPNSVVKRNSADGSVGSPHVRVGHCQASNTKPSVLVVLRVFLCLLHMGKILFEAVMKILFINIRAKKSPNVSGFFYLN